MIAMTNKTSSTTTIVVIGARNWRFNARRCPARTSSILNGVERRSSSAPLSRSLANAEQAMLIAQCFKNQFIKKLTNNSGQISTLRTRIVTQAKTMIAPTDTSSIHGYQIIRRSRLASQ